MNAAITAAVAAANEAGRPVEEALRHHLLEGILRRLTCQPFAPELVLRGGMLTRSWVPGRRATRDLDFLGRFPASAAEMAARFATLIGASVPDDGVCFDPTALRAQAIWQETAFPGVRVFVRCGFGVADEDVQVDVGFGDPLVPPAVLVAYPCLSGPTARVWAVRPETMLAWKLHGLCEHGERRWRPKDLHDLVLIGEAVPADVADLRAALRAAFESRGCTLADASAVLDAPWWTGRRAAARWDEYRRGPFREEVPSLAEAVRRARAVLGHALLGRPGDIA